MGLPRKGAAKTPRTRIVTPDGKPREGHFGWDDLWAYPDAASTDAALVKVGGTPKVPDGTRITQWVQDDTLPGGPSIVDAYLRGAVCPRQPRRRLSSGLGLL